LKLTTTIFVLSLVSTTYLGGCAVQEQWAATGGSRSDGTVQLSYEYGQFQEPEVDDQQGAELAAQRCAVWGYTGSDSFGGVIRRCQAFGGYGNCLNWLVTKNYQCVGAPSTTNAPQAASVQPPAYVAPQTSSTPGPVPSRQKVEASSDDTVTSDPAPTNVRPVVNPNALSNKRVPFEDW
jgi:hypothetical protein